MGVARGGKRRSWVRYSSETREKEGRSPALLRGLRRMSSVEVRKPREIMRVGPKNERENPSEQRKPRERGRVESQENRRSSARVRERRRG